MKARTFPAVHGKATLTKINGLEYLAISTATHGVKLYEVFRHPRSVRLRNTASNEAFDVATKGDLPGCTCQDATYRDREGGCKHQRACRAVGLIR